MIVEYVSLAQLHLRCCHSLGLSQSQGAVISSFLSGLKSSHVACQQSVGCGYFCSYDSSLKNAVGFLDIMLGFSLFCESNTH